MVNIEDGHLSLKFAQGLAHLEQLPAISIHSNCMFWLKAGVGVEVAVGGGGVALPLVHALHLQGAPQKHPSLAPNPSCYHFHMTFPPGVNPLPQAMLYIN